MTDRTVSDDELARALDRALVRVSREAWLAKIRLELAERRARVDALERMVEARS